MIMEEATICQALGRVSAIGDLYDARKEQFCQVNIFKSELPPSAIQTTDNQHIDASYSMSSSLTEKLNSLDITGQIRVSLFTKLIEPSCSGKYLSDEKTSKRAVRASFIYNVKTKVENLNIYNEAIKPMINTDVAQHTQATHIVVGIQWGANAFLSIEHNNSNNKSEKDIQAELKVMIGIISIGISGHVKSNKEEVNATKDCSFRIFADMLPKAELSQTLEGYMDFMNQMPELLKQSNNGKGKPLSYAMIPITALQKHIGVEVLTDNLIQDIEQQIIISIEDLFDEVSKVKQRVNDLYGDIETQVECCGQSALGRISEIKNKFCVNEANLRNGLAKAVVKFRSKAADASIFHDLISKFHADQYSLDNVRTMLNEFNSLVEKAQFVDHLKSKGVHYIGKNQLMDSLFLQFPKKNIYILNYSMAAKNGNEALWDTYRRAFFTLVDEIQNKNGPVCVFNENMDDDEGLSISHYINRSCITKDLVDDSEKIANLSLARSDYVDPLKNISNKRTIFEVKCPGAFAKICKNVNVEWQCSKCFKFLEYDFNGYVFCDCGGAAISCLTFKCNDPKHGIAYLTFDNSESLSKMVAELKPLREYKELNILLLGETGVGKSTWINGIEKYMTNPTLEHLADVGGEVRYLIPTKFTMTDDDFNEKSINMGSDENETSIPGQSATQMPKAYVFSTGESCIRLIDTPGIGDTRGAVQDKKNFQNILAMIGNYEEIHGICILLKPNNARLTVMFQFCIKELLTHLHKDCCKNICFVFTNARGTFYRPGDTLSSLKKLLSDNKDVEIVLAKDTIYCMDNESIRFLAASKQGIKFDETETENFSQSWKKSVMETNRLLDHIRSLKPHATQQTLSLNESRRLILALTEPLAEIAKNIQENLTLAKNKRKEIKTFDSTTKDLKEKLMVPVIDLEPEKLDYPVTVCTSSNCIELMSIGGNKKVNYKQKCHEHCYLVGVETDTYPNIKLKSCAAMNGSNNCVRCECLWSVHMHITYELQKVKKCVVDENIKELLSEKNGSIKALEMFVKQIEDRIQQLNNEQTEITKTASKFGAFLKHNAITPYNDVMDQYLEHCISRENDQVAIGGNNADLIALQKMLSKYREEVNILNETMSKNEKMVLLQPEDISKLMEKLFSLPMNGKSLQKLLALELNATDRAGKHHEVHVPSNFSKKQDKKSNDKGIMRFVKGIKEFIIKNF